MCGLAVTLLAPRERNHVELDLIWSIFTENLIQNEERGQEATGVGMVQADGSRRVWKLPINATSFIKSEDYRKQARQAFNKDTICLLGHTRRPTKGDVGHSNNNHPIVTPNMIGIHNGEITNDDQVFCDYGMPRQGVVDSEAIFALLETIRSGCSGLEYRRKIVERVSLLSGRMTTVSADVRHPKELLVLKRDMPLSMHYEESIHALFFSSRYIFLRKAFGRSVITEALETKQGYIFVADEFESLPQRFTHSFSLV
jgi:glucosamine 6-phosphate synthetase-like amidotransferase/phosphosugar isomerase protein